MSYLTLSEAAQYATQKKGFTVDPGVLLRAGIAGQLVVRCAFPEGLMRNAQQDGVFAHDGDFLVIPCAHLLELEGEGCMRVQAAFNSRKELVLPFCTREEKHLRLMIAELDQFLERLVSTAPIAPVADTPISTKKSVLVDRLRAQWPTVESDLKAAAENGLNVAKIGDRGWDEALALRWAEAKGKLKRPDALAQAMNSLPGRKHILKG